MGDRIVKNIHRVSNKISRKMDSILSDFDCTHAQFSIMIYITQNSDKDIFQRDLEEFFDIRRSSVSSTITNMEEKGYITRSSVSIDARLKKITITNRGVEVLNRCIDRIEKLEKELLDSATEEELSVFFNVLDKISDVVD